MAYARPSTADATLSHISPETVISPVQQETDATRRETLCLALGLYHEARSEHVLGQLAVGDVILNRIRDSGQSICATVWQKDQFPWTQRSVSSLVPHELPAWRSVQQTAIVLISQHRHDVTAGATLFYNDKLCDPRWAKHGTITVKIGDHVFLRP